MLFFTKLTFLLWNWNRCKTSKKQEKIVSKSICFFTSIFKGFWRQLGWILEPKLGSNKFIPPGFFARRVQEASKRLPRAPRAAQERPKGAPRASKSVPRASESDQNVPRERPRCHQRGTFWCISSFFCVFLWFFGFSVFFCVFLRFRSSCCRFLFKQCPGESQELLWHGHVKVQNQAAIFGKLAFDKMMQRLDIQRWGSWIMFPISTRGLILNFNTTLSKDWGKK